MSEEKVYSPWVHPVGRAATMARWTALYGLRQHVAIALLGGVTAPCTTCDGTGLRGTYGAIGWHICSTCHGLGEAYTVSMDELKTRRQKALESHPDAGVPNWRPDTGELISGISQPLVQGELFPVAEGAGTSFLPVEWCVSEPPPQPTPTPAIKPNFSWAELWVRLKVAWRKQNV